MKPVRILTTVLLAFAACAAHAAELRVLTHSSFSLPKARLAAFEQQSGVKLSLIKGGDAGEMLNKLILTRANPIADVVYGVDNTLLAKASAAGVIAPYSGAALKHKARYALGEGVVSTDYGYVTLNYDKAWFAKNKLALPASLQDLTKPEYAKLLVVQNPSTSSPGYAFMLATIAGMGEAQAFDWWAKLRGNGVKVAKGWSEAYYTDFSRNGGERPLVVSYATSPAAEVFYSKDKISTAPTGNLFLKGGVFRQVEGVALVKGGKEGEAAAKFVEFMRSPEVQAELQTTMWMYPVVEGSTTAPVFAHAAEPGFAAEMAPATIAAKGGAWLKRWNKVVLR
ncbi:thiamine ABC transporter substrate-binding protein [Craterilacuibacter sinensis]|uniref:Thiamine ABC transporter substrate-binding protein n=1 Tax=Craterilacuibacter sinensis TaxID=2686017 RepID=A0A845BNB6_9NEIS|nr:thiamine ABC transporter substrate-binding protein [Craterilacuibacter sinensis]MXR36754.1 thiamine ABC transporter substrate-binding protein [Craterilacuibacter sinensis]